MTVWNSTVVVDVSLLKRNPPWRIHTHKCTTKLHQKCNTSIGDHRNPSHLKTSISSRLFSHLSVLPSSRFSNPIIGVFKFYYSVSPDLCSSDCAHLRCIGQEFKNQHSWSIQTYLSLVTKLTSVVEGGRYSGRMLFWKTRNIGSQR